MSNSSSPPHPPLPLPPLCTTLPSSLLSLPVLSNNSKPRAVLKSFAQTLQIFFVIPLSFYLSFGPLPLAEKKPKASRKFMKSENVVAFSLFCFSYILFFSSSFSICCCRCWFCSIAKHILVTDLFFCSFFSPPACCCCFFCVLFVFHFLKFRLLLFFLLPLPPFHYTVTVFRVNLQVTLSDLGIILLYKVYRQSQPEALLSVPVCACLCVSAVRWLKSANAFRQQCEKVTKEFQLQEKKKKQLRRKRKRRRGKRKSEVSR